MIYCIRTPYDPAQVMLHSVLSYPVPSHPILRLHVTFLTLVYFSLHNADACTAGTVGIGKQAILHRCDFHLPRLVLGEVGLCCLTFRCAMPVPCPLRILTFSLTNSPECLPKDIRQWGVRIRWVTRWSSKEDVAGRYDIISP